MDEMERIKKYNDKEILINNEKCLLESDGKSIELHNSKSIIIIQLNLDNVIIINSDLSINIRISNKQLYFNKVQDKYFNFIKETVDTIKKM